MKNIYMAIWYGCNQRCTGCPISNNPNKLLSLSQNDVIQTLSKVFSSSDEPIEVTISGGEPTLHPDFLDVIGSIMDFGGYCSILTNGEKFADISFCDKFLDYVDLHRIRIVTTIHGSNASIHEVQNGSTGSFTKTIKGLQYLSFRGVQIVIKHCITGKNYLDTSEFIVTINDLFHPSVPIQLWGIDYCGLSKEQASALYLPFKKMQPAIEMALDKYLVIREKNYRQLSLHNLPLCSIDPYYWELMPDVSSISKGYDMYLDPTTQKEMTTDDSGKFSSNCNICDVNQYCQGAYKSLFDYFGDDAVYPIKVKQKL